MTFFTVPHNASRHSHATKAPKQNNPNDSQDQKVMLSKQGNSKLRRAKAGAF